MLPDDLILARKGVDSVSEVYRVSEDRMLPAQGLDTSCVSEMCPRGDEFVSIANVDRAIEVSHG